MNEVAKKCLHLRFHGSAYGYCTSVHFVNFFSEKKRMSEWLAYSAALMLFCTETSDFVRRQVILYGDK